MEKEQIESELADLANGTSKGVDVKLSNGITLNIQPTKCKYRDLAWSKFTLLKEVTDYAKEHGEQVKNYQNISKNPKIVRYNELIQMGELVSEDDIKELEQLKDSIELKTLKNVLDKMSAINEKMVGEYVGSIKASDSKELNKGLAYIILNDDTKVYMDEYKIRHPLLKLLGFKDKKKKDEERLWYQLYSDCTDEDNSKLMNAWRQVNDPTVFFYTMALIQGQNLLKAQNHQGQ